MPWPQLHLGDGGSPDIVTHEGWTYLVRDWRMTIEDGAPRWRVLAECPERGARQINDWMVATFADTGPLGAWVTAGGLDAHQMWRDTK